MFYLCSFYKFAQEVNKDITFSDVEDFFDKNPYLSKFAGEKRKNHGNHLLKELKYTKSYSSGNSLETFNVDLWQPAKSFPTITKFKYILVVGKCLYLNDVI